MLDSVMHADVEPFWPFLLNNPFLGFLSVGTLHKLCLCSGFVGVGLYFAVSHWLGRQLGSRDSRKTEPRDSHQ